MWIKDRTREREHPSVWLLRVFALAGTAFIIFATYSLSTDLTEQHCKASPKFLFNLAVCALSIITSFYTLVLAAGPWSWLRFVPFHWGLQVSLDFLMTILWAAAAGTSKITTSEICNACAAHKPAKVDFDAHHYTCHFKGHRDVSELFKRKGGGGHGGGGGHSSSKGKNSSSGGDMKETYQQDRLITNACMCGVMFVFFLTAIVFWIRYDGGPKPIPQAEPESDPCAECDGCEECKKAKECVDHEHAWPCDHCRDCQSCTQKLYDSEGKAVEQTEMQRGDGVRDEEMGLMKAHQSNESEEVGPASEGREKEKQKGVYVDVTEVEKGKAAYVDVTEGDKRDRT